MDTGLKPTPLRVRTLCPAKLPCVGETLLTLSTYRKETFPSDRPRPDTFTVTGYSPARPAPRVHLTAVSLLMETAQGEPPSLQSYLKTVLNLVPETITSLPCWPSFGVIPKSQLVSCICFGYRSLLHGVHATSKNISRVVGEKCQETKCRASITPKCEGQHGVTLRGDRFRYQVQLCQCSRYQI